MSRRRTKAAPKLTPTYVEPQLNSMQRAAARAWHLAAHCSQRQRPKPGSFDPLQMRIGMRANLVLQRAGWVFSNPLYDATLRRRPDIDPSLPGPGWLRELYGWNPHSDLTLLPGVRAAIEARRAARHPTEQAAQVAPITLPAKPAQLELFA